MQTPLRTPGTRPRAPPSTSRGGAQTPRTRAARADTTARAIEWSALGDVVQRSAVVVACISPGYFREGSNSMKEFLLAQKYRTPGVDFVLLNLDDAPPPPTSVGQVPCFELAAGSAAAAVPETLLQAAAKAAVGRMAADRGQCRPLSRRCS